MTKRWPLSTRLISYVLALLVILQLIALATFRDDYDRRYAQEVNTSVVIAENAAVAVEAVVRDIERTTVAMSGALARLPALDQANAGTYLQRVIQEYPTLRAIFVTDVRGRVIATNGTGVGVDLATRPYMIELIAGMDPVWSGSLTGIESGEVTVAFGRAVRLADGPRLGFLIFAFHPNRLLLDLRVVAPPDSQITLVDESGLILYDSVRSDVPPAERDLSAVPPIASALAGNVTKVSGQAVPFMNEPRYGAVVPVARVGWALAFTRPQAPLDAVLRTRLINDAALNTLVLLVAALFTIVLANRLVKPIAHLARAASEIARGERPAVPAEADAGPEVRELATAMRQMSEAVAAREDDLRYALRTRDEFLSAAAHELKTPLTSIKGYSQMLHRSLAKGRIDDDALLQGLDRIDVATTKMTASIEELLELAKLRLDPTLDLSLKPTELVALIGEVVGDYAVTSERHRFLVESQVESVIGDWDPVRLERVILNLLSNAVKYSPEGGDVVIRIDATDSSATVDVIDSGIGIPPEDLPLIFERFRRGGNVVGRISGTGIGLTLVRQIVAQHEGRVSVSSVPGQGSIFTVTLPLTK